MKIYYQLFNHKTYKPAIYLLIFSQPLTVSNCWRAPHFLVLSRQANALLTKVWAVGHRKIYRNYRVFVDADSSLVRWDLVGLRYVCADRRWNSLSYSTFPFDRSTNRFGLASRNDWKRCVWLGDRTNWESPCVWGYPDGCSFRTETGCTYKYKYTTSAECHGFPPMFVNRHHVTPNNSIKSYKVGFTDCEFALDLLSKVISRSTVVFFNIHSESLNMTIFTLCDILFPRVLYWKFLI